MAPRPELEPGACELTGAATQRIMHPKLKNRNRIFTGYGQLDVNRTRAEPEALNTAQYYCNFDEKQQNMNNLHRAGTESGTHI